MASQHIQFSISPTHNAINLTIQTFKDGYHKRGRWVLKQDGFLLHSSLNCSCRNLTLRYSEKTEKVTTLDADTNLNYIYQNHIFKLENITHQERNWETENGGREFTLTSTRTHLFIFQNHTHKCHLLERTPLVFLHSPTA